MNKLNKQEYQRKYQKQYRQSEHGIKCRKLYYQNHKKKIREHNDKWRKTHKEEMALYMKKYQLKRLYDITLDQYNQMFDHQLGCCFICGKHQSTMKKALAVDHNHISGKIRCLLCSHCNTQLGWFEKHQEEICKITKSSI